MSFFVSNGLLSKLLGDDDALADLERASLLMIVISLALGDTNES